MLIISDLHLQPSPLSWIPYFNYYFFKNLNIPVCAPNINVYKMVLLSFPHKYAHSWMHGNSVFPFACIILDASRYVPWYFLVLILHIQFISKSCWLYLNHSSRIRALLTTFISTIFLSLRLISWFPHWSPLYICFPKVQFQPTDKEII